jgi:hypothetical protein
LGSSKGFEKDLGDLKDPEDNRSKRSIPLIRQIPKILLSALSDTIRPEIPALTIT